MEPILIWMRNIHTLIIARFLSGLYFAVPIQTIFLISKGLSLTEVLWLESILLLSIFLFEIPTGVLGDRIGRKWSLVLSSVVSVLAWIPWFLADGFMLFAVSYFMNGISVAFFSGAGEALIYDDLRSQGKADKMQKIYGIFLASGVLATACAALLGGFLTKSLSEEYIYFAYTLTACMQFVGLLLHLTVREVRHSAEGEDKEHRPERGISYVTDGLALLKNNIPFRRLVFLSIFTLPFSVSLFYLFQPYFQEANVSTEWFGVAVFISSLFVVGAKLVAHKVEAIFGVEKGFLIITLIPALLWGLMAAVFHPVLSVLLFILNDAAGNIRDPIFADYLNRHIESRNRATVLSMISLFESAYLFIIRPLGGFFADIDLRLSFLFFAFLIIFGSVFFRIKSPKSVVYLNRAP